MLRQLREARGWSWADLACALRETASELSITTVQQRRLASIQRAVARWESTAEPTGPGERYQYLLAHLYARTPTGTLALGPGSDFAHLLQSLRAFATPETRIDHLVAAVSAPRARTPETDEPDPTVLRHLATTKAQINAEIGTTPLVRLQLQLAPLVESCQHWVQKPAPSQQVLALATDTLGVAARLAFETRDDETATRLYQQAGDAANRLNDRSHRAAVLTSHAMVTLHATSNPHAAAPIAHAAVAEAHRSASYPLRARAHAVAAEINARAGHTHRARTALDRARTTLDQLRSEPTPTAFSADRLDGFEGLCALAIGDAEHAHTLLQRCLDSLTHPRDAVQRGIVATDLALARLHLDEPTASLALLHDTIELTAATGARVPAQRLRYARRALQQAHTTAHLAELDDHLHDTLLGR